MSLHRRPTLDDLVAPVALERGNLHQPLSRANGPFPWAVVTSWGLVTPLTGILLIAIGLPTLIAPSGRSSVGAVPVPAADDVAYRTKGAR